MDLHRIKTKGKKRLRQTILVLLTPIVSGLFPSCYERLVLESDPGAETKLVLNGVISADSVLRVNLTRSMVMAETASPDYVEGARVWAEDGKGQEIPLHYLDSGYYQANGIVARENRSYTFYAKQGDTLVSAKVDIPAKPVFTMDTLHDPIKKHFNTPGFTLNLTILDADFGRENYYMLYIRAFLLSEDGVEINKYFRFNRYFYADDPAIEVYLNGMHSENYSEEFDYLYFLSDDLPGPREQDYVNLVVFSDRLFNGKSHTFSLDLGVRLSYYGDNCRFYPVVCAINQDYYQFLTSCYKYNHAFYDMLIDKVPLYSNIQNGLGILGGANSARDSLDIKVSISEHY